MLSQYYNGCGIIIISENRTFAKDKFWRNILKQVIIGRSGSGKTTYITNQIKEDLKAGYENILVIVPDQFTFETERELIKQTGKGLFEIRVLSFRRLIDVLRDELGTKGCFELDDVNKAMFVNKLLYDYDAELTVYKGAYRMPGFSFDMAKAITECKQFGVDYEALEALDIKGKTKDKMQDIAALYKSYSLFKDRFKDNEDIINIITQKVPSSGLIKDARIYIDHFDVFTFQGYNMIEEMAKVCSRLCVALCTDGSGSGLFRLTTDTLNKLRDRVPDMETVELGNCKKDNDIGFLEANLFTEKSDVAKTNGDDSVELFSFATVLQEIDHAIAKIIELKNSGYHYSDICLMTGDIDEYGRALEQGMIDCDVPYFLDRKIPLMSSRISKFLIYSLKNCFTFETDNYVGMLKQGIMSDDFKNINRFENYMLKNGLKKSLTPIQNDDALDKIRKLISSGSFKSIINKANTVMELTQACVNYLCSFEITFEDEIEERSFKKLIEILERMGEIFQDTQMDGELFTSILTTGITSVTLGVIPDKRDSVVIGDISRTKIERAKCLLVIGVSDGIIPKITEKTGLISDYDSSVLDVKIGRDSFDLNNLEQLLTYKMLSKPRDYLYLSYSQRSLYGKERYGKMLFSKVKGLLNINVNMDVPFNEDMNLRLLRAKHIAFKNLVADAFAGEDNYITRGVMDYFSKKQDIEQLLKPRSYDLSITQRQAEDIYAGSTISASRIETYYKCAFMQFIRYGLRPVKRELYKINKLDTGTLLHSIIEEFSKELISKTQEYRDKGRELTDLYDSMKQAVLDSGMIESIVKNRLEEDGISIYGEDNIGRMMEKRITQMGKEALSGILDELKDSNFVMTYSEAELHKLGEYSLEDVKLQGKVDRMDVSDEGVRVVDYKQGGSALDYTSVFGGIKLQLLVYMGIVLDYYREKQSKELIPMSMEYYQINTEYKSCDTVNKFLTDMAAPRTSEIAVGDGKKKTQVAPDDMNRLVSFGMHRAREAAKRIYQGDISIRPYFIPGREKDNGCQYCDFKHICKNDNLANKRVLKKVELEDITSGGEDDGLE